MKRILLTSTALVAFGGAAAADVSFSGTAEFSYNTNTGYASDTEISVSASTALDNGYTASASFTIDPEAAADEISAGDISISSDAASITYHVGHDGTGAASLGTTLSEQTAVDGIHQDFTTTDSTNDDDATITASASMGGATLRVSLHGGATAATTDDTYEFGVSADLGGASIDAGMTGDTFGAVISGDAGGASYTLGFAGDGSYAINAATTAAGADVTLDFGDAGWAIGASMPLGGATVGVSVGDGEDWEVSVSTDLDGLGLTASVADGDEYDISASYDAGDITVAFATDEAADWSADVTYDMGNGVTVGAGAADGDNSYAELGLDLGSGASAAVQYSTAADINPAEDIAVGTTVSVSFSF